MYATLQRYGGILIRPRSTLLGLRAGEGRHDGWILTALFVLGSQVEHLAEAIARFEVFRSVLLLVNALALAVLTPVLAGFLVEGIVGTGRRRYRHLPLVALVLVATIGNLLRQQGVVWPGPRYLPEMLGLVWVVGLAVWIRKRGPAEPLAPELELGAPPRPRLAVLGGLVIATTAFSAGQDLGLSLDKWDSYSPAGPSDPVPEFRARVDDGTTLDPPALTGQVTLLTFWATWCHACGLEMPVLAEIEQDYADTDLHIYGVNRDSGDLRERKALVEPYKLDKQIGFPQIYDDGQLARAFGVEAIPHMVLIDKRGLIRRVHMGRVSERTLSREIDELLAE